MKKTKRPNIFRRLKNFFTEKQDDSSLSDTVQSVLEHPQGLFPHILAMRGHLIRIVLYMVIGTSLAFTYSTPILEFLARPLPGGMESLQAVDVTEPVGTVMRVSLLVGFAVSFPLLAMEIWLFFAPGLHGHERLYTMLAIPIASLFFIFGMSFAYYFMLPFALPVLLSFVAGIKTLVRPNSYYPFVVNMLFWIGLFSEFPLVVLILARLGLVRGRDLLNQWRLAIVIIAVVAAIVTPTTDLANMGLTMAPMIFLYFLSIGLAFIAQRSRRDKATA